MNLNEIKDYLDRDWKRTANYIEDSLKSDIDLLDKTNRSILSHSGKQLRPLVALLVARACSPGNTADEDSCRYAAGAELLHNATLLHDDVADDSDQRRGMPTIRSMMGPSVSVLIGDYWLVKAMGLILESRTDTGKVIRLFSRTLSDLAEGEILQLQKARSGDTDENDYIRIIFNKTASLFEAAAVSAAISVKAGEDTIRAVREYAVSLGLAFQIRDDIFDYSPEMDTGKPAGVDILEQKITLPLLGAFRNAGKEKESAIRERIGRISENPGQTREEILSFVRENKGIDYARKVLDSYIGKAVDALKQLPESQDRTYLEELAHFVAERQS
ncbi:MAG: polyprenyl synthetase family protein [Bacteroidetes bacterium]|uniref:Polyprenyl synthetase family protein n=1 Tax=Candidatus Cryptobacteroides gallistercoris TaxID=2840765 RepID=A0A940DLZ2_9BACT|nr:polyprenyl synthetase family protein [Candidatus Cryptobacteroides gallistercoris]